jgi:rhodanese-related sulfurtransferase
MYASIHDKIFSLPDECLLYPGHDYSGRTVTSVLEEKTYNPRCGGARSLNDFVEYMDNLGLPHPGQLAVALPANLQCGEPTDQKPMPVEPTWAPLRYTYAGIWEVESHWLGEHLGEVQVIDVRPKEEIERGPLGLIHGSRVIALADIDKAAAELPKDKPIVVVCRSGGRSAQATVKLQKAGFDKVANLAGGVLRWRAFGGSLDGEGASA